jgi:subtilisin family serine protease
VVEENRKDNQKPVRVAVLDTGVDATHPEIRLALSNRRIIAYMGFPESFDPLNDQNGHGTHGVSVLLKTAPLATIYLARTVDDADRILDSNDYEETIKVSLDDIIFISGNRMGDGKTG